MPIRINLLAEEQAAEEMRRRDPVKRALFAGAALLVLMIGWIGITQISVIAARSEMAHTEARLKKVEDGSRQARSNQMALAETDLRLRALEKYSTNRFFWGTFLDNIQRVSIEAIRLMEIHADQKYAAGDVTKFFTTNMTVKYAPESSGWKFWSSPKPSASLDTLVSENLVGITNRPPFTTNWMEYSVKAIPTLTNKAAGLMVAKVEFSNPPWAGERSVVEIRGRDYGSPPGAAIDELARRIHASPYFQQILERESEEGFRFTERPPQPRPDPQDPVNPGALFVPFTIELTLKERILTSE